MLALLSDPLTWISAVGIALFVFGLRDARRQARQRERLYDPMEVAIVATLYSSRDRDVLAAPVHPPIKDPVA